MFQTVFHPGNTMQQTETGKIRQKIYYRGGALQYTIL